MLNEPLLKLTGTSIVHADDDDDDDDDLVPTFSLCEPADLTLPNALIVGVGVT